MTEEDQGKSKDAGFSIKDVENDKRTVGDGTAHRARSFDYTQAVRYNHSNVAAATHAKDKDPGSPIRACP